MTVRARRPRYTPDDGLLPQLRKARKAIAGFVVPGLIALADALRAGSDGGSHITAAEVATIAAAALATSGVVYAVRNGSAPTGP